MNKQTNKQIENKNEHPENHLVPVQKVLAGVQIHQRLTDRQARYVRRSILANPIVSGID